MENTSSGGNLISDGKSLAYLALVDDLTSLFNRRYFFQVFPELVKEMKKSELPLSLVMIDVDKFKSINDNFGHLSGDEVLSKVGQALKSGSGKSDIVVRYAGDEFIIVIPGLSALKAKENMDRLSKEISSLSFKNKNIKISLSMGVSEFPKDSSDVNGLIEKADKALYSSKNSGRAMVTIFSESEYIPETIPPCPVFIDQAETVNKTVSLIKLLSSGSGSILTVSGAHGSGKTRFLEETARMCLERDIPTVLISGSSSDVNSPYSFIFKSLRQILSKDTFSKAASDIKSSYGYELAPILPDFAGQDASSHIPEADPAVLNNALNASFNLIGRESPIALLFDDFHFSDTFSLEAVQKLSSSISTSKILLVLIYTPEDLTSSLPFISHERKIINCSSVISSLVPFTPDDIFSFIKSSFGGLEISPGSLAALHTATAGNPLFLSEILQILFHESVLSYAGGNWSLSEIKPASLPNTLKEAVRKRLSFFDEGMKQTLTEAAAIGENVDFKLLKEVRGSSEGELLGFLDKARKSGLVKENISDAGETYNFSSREVREILYDLIEEKEKKELHNKIGDVVEKVFAQKMTEYLPLLAYQYLQAGDTGKAAGITAQLSGRFSSRKPSGVIKKKLPTMDEDTFQRVVDFLRYLRAALINIQLYPPGSNLIQDSVNLVLSQVEPLLSTRGSVTVSEIEKRLVADGKTIDEKGRTFVASFLNLMLTHSIKSITFNAGTTPDEIISFIKLLNEKPDVIKKAGGLKKCFAKEHISNIAIDEKIFVTAGSEQDLIQDNLTEALPESGPEEFSLPSDQQAATPLSGNGKRLETLPDIPASIMENISAFKSGGGTPEDVKELFSDQSGLPPEMFDKIDNEITKAFSSLDSEKLLSLMQGLSEKKHNSGLKSQVLSRVSEEKLFSLLDLIISDFKALKETELSAEKQAGFKALLGDLLSASREKNILPQIYERLAEAELVEPSTIPAPGTDETAPFKSIPAISIAPPETITKFLALIDDLLSKKITEKASSLISKVLKEACSENPLVKEKAATLLGSLAPILVNHKATSISAFPSKLNTLLAEESSVDVISQLLLPATVLIVEEYKKGEFDSALKSIQTVLSKIDDPVVKQSFFETLNAHLGPAILGDMSSRNVDIQNKASELALLLGKLIAPAMVGLFLSEENPAVIKIINATLTKMGDDCLEALDSGLTPEAPVKALLNLLDLSISLSASKLNNKISLLLSHDSPKVKIKSVQALAKLKASRYADLIIPLLFDDNPLIVNEAIRAIGALKHKVATPELINIFEPSPANQQKEILLALGRIRAKEALPLLQNVLSDKSFFFRHTYSDPVRLSAFWALIQIDKDAALEIAKTVRSSGSPEMKKMASNLLRKKG